MALTRSIPWNARTPSSDSLAPPPRRRPSPTPIGDLLIPSSSWERCIEDAAGRTAEVRADLPRRSRGADPDTQLLTPRDVAEVLRVKLPRVYELVKARRLRAHRVGRQLRFRPRDVDAFLDRAATGRW